MLNSTKTLVFFLAVIVGGIACAPEMKSPPVAPTVKQDGRVRPARGVCPPFKLRDEQGNVIDPVAGINAEKPYSPKQTCGRSGCHDYAKITKGYHFTQGKGEAVPAAHRKRFAWVTSPGQYGGRW